MQNFPKNKISYPLTCTFMCAYHGVRNVSHRDPLSKYTKFCAYTNPPVAQSISPPGDPGPWLLKRSKLSGC